MAKRLLALLLFIALLVMLIASGASAMGYQWQWQRVPPFIAEWDEGRLWPGPLLRGLLITLQVAGLSMLGTLLIGAILTLLRRSRSLLGPPLALLYLSLVRTTPQLVQLYLLYFLLGPLLGLEPMPCAVLSLSLYQGAYTAEVMRSGLEAISRGQWEAAFSLGLPRHIVWIRVIAPQWLRIVLPPLTNELVALIKNSALVSVIAVFDLSNEGRTLVADTFITFEVWFTVAALYLLITLGLSGAAHLLARRLRRP